MNETHRAGAAPERPPRSRSVTLELCDSVEALTKARATLAPGLRYAAELRELWDPRRPDSERFVHRAILAVALAKLEGGRVIGFGELLAARPSLDEPSRGRAFCRISRLDVAPAYRRRAFIDRSSKLPISELLLRGLLGGAPYGAEVMAEVTPDAENLFEKAGFKLLDSGRWRYTR